MWGPLTDVTTSSMCPGRHLSNNSLYAVVSSVLAVFDIKPPLDADGKPSQLKADVTSGLISYGIQLCWFWIQANCEVLLDILCRLIALSHRDRMLRVLFVILWRWINRRVFTSSIIYWTSKSFCQVRNGCFTSVPCNFWQCDPNLAQQYQWERWVDKDIPINIQIQNDTGSARLPRSWWWTYLAW